MSALNTRRANAAALVGAGIAAGVLGAWTLSSNAQGSTAPSGTSNGTSTATAAPAAPGQRPPMGDHDGDRAGFPGGGPHGDEKSVSGAKESTLKAAALKQIPGGTVQRVETDSGDAAYEVHMTDKDGKQVTVKFDKNLKFVAVEDGMGK